MIPIDRASSARTHTHTHIHTHRHAHTHNVCVCVCVCMCVCITNIRIVKSSLSTFVCLLFVSKSFSSLLWTSRQKNREFFSFGQCHGQYSSTHRISGLPKTVIRGHNHLMDVVASLSRDSKIGPVRVNHKVSTTGDGTRKQGDVEISNFPISLRDGLVIDVSFVCEFKGSSRAPGGWDNGVRHSNDVLQALENVKNNKYKSVYEVVTRCLHLPS